MNDLISRSALLEKAEGGTVCWFDIKHAPAVDAETVIKSLPYVKAALEMAKQTVEPVIRCKDCYYWMKAKVNRNGGLVCPKSGMEIVATDYCSRAEKRECKYDR